MSLLANFRNLCYYFRKTVFWGLILQESELIELITKIKERKTETSKIEFKSAKGGVPEKLYDTFSSFSNTEGGVILFGIDEKARVHIFELGMPIYQ